MRGQRRNPAEIEEIAAKLVHIRVHLCGINYSMAL